MTRPGTRCGHSPTPRGTKSSLSSTRPRTRSTTTQSCWPTCCPGTTAARSIHGLRHCLLTKTDSRIARCYRYTIRALLQREVMRLSAEHAASIRRLVAEETGARAKVRVFGSRLDDTRRGGDLDLLVELDFPVREP